MTAQVIHLPTRPQADLRGFVEDVARARRVTLGTEGLLDVVAIATDILRGHGDARPESQEQAVEEALDAYARGVLA